MSPPAKDEVVGPAPGGRLSRRLVFAWGVLSYLIAADRLGSSSSLGLWSAGLGRLLEAAPLLFIIGWEMAYKSRSAVFFTRSCGHTAHRSLFETRPLPPAPTWLIVLSLFSYVCIGLQGVRFALLGTESCATEAREAELRATTLAMCALYSLEAIVALKWDVTPMSRWARATFVLHHLPFAIIVGIPLLFDATRPSLIAYRCTVPLDLMTGLNESMHAVKALSGADISRWIELPRCGFIMVLISYLVYVETGEIWQVFNGDSPTWLKAHAVATSLAPVYHVLDVIPTSLRGMRKAWRRLNSGAELEKKATKETWGSGKAAGSVSGKAWPLAENPLRKIHGQANVQRVRQPSDMLVLQLLAAAGLGATVFAVAAVIVALNQPYLPEIDPRQPRLELGDGLAGIPRMVAMLLGAAALGLTGSELVARSARGAGWGVEGAEWGVEHSVVGSGQPRVPYFISRAPRPLYRGLLMHALLPVWPVLAVGYVISCELLATRTDAALTLMRVTVACATTLNVLFSDRYHNGDKLAPRGAGEAELREYEANWLRWDFVGISAVLTSTFCLWSAHLHFVDPFWHLAALSGAMTAGCACAAFALFERKGSLSVVGEVLIKAILGVQFVFLFGYMVHRYLESKCAPHTSIWFTYLPGFVVYVLKVPRDGRTIGAHDVFHGFIIAGHLLSCICDIVNIRWDCYSGYIEG